MKMIKFILLVLAVSAVSHANALFVPNFMVRFGDPNEGSCNGEGICDIFQLGGGFGSIHNAVRADMDIVQNGGVPATKTLTIIFSLKELMLMDPAQANIFITDIANKVGYTCSSLSGYTKQINGVQITVMPSSTSSIQIDNQGIVTYTVIGT